MLTIYGREDCPFCQKAKEFADVYFEDFEYVTTPKGSEVFKDLKEQVFQTYGKEVITVPQIFYKDIHIGGYEDLVNWTLREDTP